MKNEETHSCFFITTIVHAEVEVPNHVSFTVGGAPSSIVIRFHLRHCPFSLYSSFSPGRIFYQFDNFLFTLLF
jgi:hypothetical protein